MRRLLLFLLFAFPAWAQQSGLPNDIPPLPSNLYQVTSFIGGSSLTSTPLGNAIYISSQCGVQPNCVTVADDGHSVSDATTTNTSPIVTSPTANFTGTDALGRPIAKAGQQVWVLNTSGSEICPGTNNSVFTIASVDSATQIHLSGNCTAALAGNGILAWATDNTTAVNNAFGTAITNCLSVQLRIHSVKINAAWFIQAFPAACQGAFPQYNAVAVMGPQEFSTQFLIAPDFNWASCTGGSTAHACVLGQKSASMENVTITALGWNNFTLAGTTYLMELNDGAHLKFVNLTSVGSAVTNLVCLIDESSQGDLYVGGTINCGNEQLLVNTINGPGHATGWLAQGAQSGTAAVEVSNTNCAVTICGLISENGIYLNGQSVNAVQVDTGANYWSHADLIKTGSFLGVTGTAYLDGTAVVTGIQVNSGGVLNIRNTKTGNGGTTAAINCLAGSKVFDLGGNTFNMGSGQPNCSGLLFGSNSITGTVQTLGNWAVPAGSGAGQWGTTPSVATCSGNSTIQQCTITVGSGTVGANPVLTVTMPTNFLGTPIASAKMVGGTAALATFTNPACTWSTSTTTCAFTYQGTPAASSTIILQISAGT